jgi:hypothetical protein
MSSILTNTTILVVEDDEATRSALLIYVETKNNRSFGIVRMTVKVPPMFGRISLV